jgi:hypothetical protein
MLVFWTNYSFIDLMMGAGFCAGDACILPELAYGCTRNLSSLLILCCSR